MVLDNGVDPALGTAGRAVPDDAVEVLTPANSAAIDCPTALTSSAVTGSVRPATCTCTCGPAGGGTTGTGPSLGGAPGVGVAANDSPGE